MKEKINWTRLLTIVAIMTSIGIVIGAPSYSDQVPLYKESPILWLENCIEKGDYVTAKELLGVYPKLLADDANPSPFPSFQSRIAFVLADKADLELTKLLIQKGLHFRADGNDGFLSSMPWFISSKPGDPEVKEIVLTNLAYLFIRNKKVKDAAYRKKAKAIIRYFESLGYDLNKIRKSGAMPLHSLFSDGIEPKLYEVKWLKELGADFNALSSKGVSPLFWAVSGFWGNYESSERYELAAYLLEQGADPNLK